MRCFIAIRPSEEYLHKYEDVAYSSDSFNLSKWFDLIPPNNVHITLKFLGEIDQESPKYSSFIEELSELQIPEQTVRTKKIFEFFPSKGHPKILYHGLYEDKVGSLLGMARDLDRISALISREKNNVNFIPHLTLGRAKKGLSMPEDYKGLPKYIKAFELSFKIKELVLFRSELKKTGAIYTELAKFKGAMYNGA